MCEHNEEPIIGYIIHRGIERKTMRCSVCHELWDYYPQYEGDDI